jgi:hypothetical protein
MEFGSEPPCPDPSSLSAIFSASWLLLPLDQKAERLERPDWQEFV